MTAVLFLAVEEQRDVSAVRSAGCWIAGRRDGRAFLLARQLCFLTDLWSLRPVGRSLCDYRLRADLYLTFNYLRGVCSSLMPIHPPPSSLPPVGREEPSTLLLRLFLRLALCLWHWARTGICCDSGSVPLAPRAPQTDAADINAHCGV